MKPIHMKTPITIITTPQVRVEAADLTTVKVVTNNLEGSYNETEAKDLSIVNLNLNKTVLKTAIIVNPIFRKIKQIALEAKAKAVAVDLSNS